VPRDSLVIEALLYLILQNLGLEDLKFLSRLGTLKFWKMGMLGLYFLFFFPIEVFQHPNMSKAIHNARKFQSKIAKCSEFYHNVQNLMLKKFVTLCKHLYSKVSISSLHFRSRFRLDVLFEVLVP